MLAIQHLEHNANGTFCTATIAIGWTNPNVIAVRARLHASHAEVVWTNKHVSNELRNSIALAIARHMWD